MDYFRGTQNPWNMMPQQQKEANALTMNKKIMSIFADTEKAIQERNAAIVETKEALQARDEAIKQRDEALLVRDKALMERDNARQALLYLETAISSQLCGNQNHRGIKRLRHPVYHQVDIAEALNDAREAQITDAFPLSSITADAVKSSQVKQTEETKSSKGPKAPRKGKKMGEDSNVQGYSDGIKYKSEWDIHEVGLNLIAFDDSTMPGPVCSCTGVNRPCYKWGNGGWQSSCCTTTLSMYPLPQIPNKRHGRVSGRKMSGSVFTRLLTRMAKAGHDLSVPLDLKDFWAKHGTNRYIIIK